MPDILETHGLMKRYGERPAVSDLSFSIGEGEICSLLGPNGAGKTTTISMLSTLITPSGGDATIAGHSIIRDPQAVRRAIGVVPQEIALYDDLTALAATGWGAMLAAVARTPAQAGSIGTARMLAFGVLGGNFGSNVPLPSALSALGAITPNRWGMTGFERLAAGGGMNDIGANLAALCLMAAVTLGIATIAFRRTSTTR